MSNNEFNEGDVCPLLKTYNDIESPIGSARKLYVAKRQAFYLLGHFGTKGHLKE